MFVPTDAGTPEERLGKLKEEFDLSPLIVEALLKEQIHNMEECRFFLGRGDQEWYLVQQVALGR